MNQYMTWHGTLGGYIEHECRCKRCINAFEDDQRTRIGGHDSYLYARLEQISDYLDWADKTSPLYEKALTDYRVALEAVAAMRAGEPVTITRPGSWDPVPLRKAPEPSARGHAPSRCRAHSAARPSAA